MLAAVEWHEQELRLTEIAARPALALLRRTAVGDRSMTEAELRATRTMAETLLKVQYQVDRLPRAVQALPTTAGMAAD